MSTYLVTGANRGLGSSLVEVLASQPADQVSQIFATSRSQEPNEALRSIVDQPDSRVQHVHLDLTSKKSISSAAASITSRLNGKGLDYLLLNAAVRDDWTPKLEDMTYLSAALETNVVGTHDVVATFLPLLRKGKDKKIVFFSSTLGIISTAQTDPKMMNVAFPAYKISKAATHMMSALWSNELKGEGFCVYAQSPGNLKTELAGGDRADLPPEVGARQVVEIAQKARREDTGRHRSIWVDGWQEERGVAGLYDGKDHGW